MEPSNHIHHHQKRISSLFLLSAASVSLFIVAAVTIPTTNSLIRKIFPKSNSLASVSNLDNLPVVNLKVFQNGVEATNGVVDVGSGEEGITLSWEVKGSAKICAGRSWGGAQVKEWEGPKELNGSVTIAPLTNNNPYVFTLDCTSESGDAAGDSVTVNVGAADSTVPPSITQFEVFSEGKMLEISSSRPVVVKNPELNFTWRALNINSQYSICILSGSWPSSYEQFNGEKVDQKLKLYGSKIHTLTLYCSNENSSTKQSASFLLQ